MPNQFWTGMGNLGTQAAQGAIGAGMGLLLQRGQDQRQLNMQRKLQRMEMEGTKEMTDYNYGKQLQLWKDTSYGAQKEQMMQAGLNPGLMYGMGGGGGQTAQIAQGNVTGGQAPKGGGEATGMAMQMGAMQLQLLQAQKELLTAQKDKTNAEIPQIGAQTGKLGQETINLKTQNALQEIERAFQEETFKNRASMINIGLSKLIEEVQIIENEREISDTTKSERIKLIAAELKNKIADTLNKAKNTAKSEKEINHIDQQIKMLEQQFNINAMDEAMAKDGFNPKAGTMLKLVHNLFNFIKQLF